MEDDLELLETMNKIRDYFRRNPDAADTVDGVACWLHAAPVEDTKNLIQRALHQLVLRKEVNLEPLPGGKTLYRLHTKTEH